MNENYDYNILLKNIMDLFTFIQISKFRNQLKLMFIQTLLGQLSNPNS